MADQPISVHYQQMEEWLNDRKAVFGKKNKSEFNTLLELAPKLVQQVQYDIPAAQKQIKKCASSIDECHRVCEDAERIAVNAAEKRRKLLLEYELAPQGSEGEGIAEEGAELQGAIARRIEESRRRLMRELLAFAEAHLVAFKKDYSAIVNRGSGELGSGCLDVFCEHFPWLDRLLTECTLPLAGDATDTPAEDPLGEGAGADGEDTPPPHIDWGDDVAADDACTTAIGQEEAANAVEINWDAAEEIAATGVVVNKAAVSHDDGAGEDALAALPPKTNGRYVSLDVARPKDRTNLLTELSACRCFAGERLAVKDSHFAAFHAAVGALVATLTSSMEAEFVRMRVNFRERDLFEDRVACFDRAIAAARSRKASHEAKGQESKVELDRLEPELDALLSTARMNRDECVAALSRIFPGRKVMIVGDINKYL